MSRDLATRRMRIGYDRTLERFIWAGSLVLGLAAGFLAGYLWRKPVLIEKIVAAPAAYCACPVTSTSCVEVARLCYAQKRLMAVKP